MQKPLTILYQPDFSETFRNLKQTPIDYFNISCRLKNSNMSKQQLFDEAISLLERYARCILKEEDEDKKERFTALADQVKFYCELKEKNGIQDHEFKNIIETIEAPEENRSANEILKIYQNNCKESIKKMPNINQNKKYLDFLGLAENDGEDDIVTVSETLNIIDPISKCRMVDPVKNTRCGHSYEKSTILELITTRPNTRCPIVGCTAKTYVKKNELVPDQELKRHLSQIS